MRPNAVLLSLAILIIVSATASAQDQPVQVQTLETAVNNGTASRQQQLDLARYYVQSGRYYEASKIADRLLALDRNDADASALSVEAKRDLKQIADKKVGEAEASARKTGATDADRLALANAYFDAGSYRAAADAYAKLPPSLMTQDVRLRQARALAWTGQQDAAERVYSRLLKEQPTPELSLEYGRLLSWMGASRAAVKTLRDVYTATPTEDAAVALANAEAWSNDHESAIRILTDFTASHPGAVQAQELLSQMKSSPSLRIERLDRMIAAEPYNLALRVERARLLVDAGRYAEAINETQFVRDHSQGAVEGLDAISQQARDLRQQEIAKTEAQLKAIDTSKPQNAAEILSLAKAYSSLSDYGHAIPLYESYLRMNPNDTEARVQYARVLSWDKRWAASEREYESLIASNPDRADLRLEYAQVLSYDADFNGAMSMFSSLTDLSDNPRANLYAEVPQKAHYNLGQIYRWYGWNDHAVAEQNQALALDGGYQPARDELDLVRHLRPTSQFGGNYATATDSAHFNLQRFDLIGEKWTSQRTGWNGSIGRHRFSQYGDAVSAVAASGGINYRWSDNVLARANVGLDAYDHGLGTRPFWGLGAQWMPTLTSRAALDYNHYDLIYDVFTLRSLTRPVTNTRDAISIDDLRAHYDHNGGGFFSWLADASYGFISDNNRRAAAHGLATFRVLRSPYVAIKGDGRWLSYDHRAYAPGTTISRYWSPTDYRSLAAVLQIGDNIRNRFFWSVEGKYGKSWENGAASNLRSYAANLTLPINDRLDAVANYTYGQSGRFETPFGAAGPVNYWQRYWFAGLRVKQLFSRDDRDTGTPYYYDNRSLTGSPVVPPIGEVH